MPDSPETSPLSIAIRAAEASDIPEILRQRRGMYIDMGYTDEPKIEAMIRVSAIYLSNALSDGSFRAWLAYSGEHAVGGGALIVSPWLAHPYDLECRRATILNVYVDPKYRRRGVARRLMETMIGWCRGQGFARVALHASEDGRHLYESMGFELSNEMRLKLR